MKKIVWLILILFVVGIFLFSLYSYLVDKKIINKIGASVEKDEKINPKNSIKDLINKNSGGGSGVASSDSLKNNKEVLENNSGSGEELKLPDDFYNASCGFYFKDYGVCNGTCPQGVCVNEGRSCYCKKI